MSGSFRRTALAAILLAPACVPPRPAQAADVIPLPPIPPSAEPAAAPVQTAAKPAPMPEPAPNSQPELRVGTNTGRPLPRFAALRFDEINLRAGPGARYPIKWVYQRRDLPVEIQREFEVWRLIRAEDGTRGWVHQAVLVNRRTAVTTAPESVLRSGPDPAAPPVAHLKPGVIIRLRDCQAGSPWCQASVQDYRGYIKRADVWGTLPDEAIP